MQNQCTEYEFFCISEIIAMLDELEPRIVLVYGAMSDTIFNGLETRTEFVQYSDWTRRMKKK